MSRSVKRQYDSTRRRAQAEQTRELIIRSAHELFITAGYGRTTIAQIARAAGVAVETVYSAFGSKRNLLRQVWYVDLRGDERDIPLYDRAGMQVVLAESDLSTRIRKHAEFVTHSFRRIAPLQRALQGAAASEPAAAAMLAEYSERRLDVATRYARAAAATGQLAVSEEECRDVLWAMLDGALWHDLVVERGWSDERFAAWLARIWVAQLVAA